MHQLDRLRKLKSEIYKIANKYNSNKLYVFGSCARKEENSNSDVDFLVEFNSNASLFDQTGLEYDLTKFLQCKVDVVSNKALKGDKFATNVLKDMVIL